MSSFLKSVSRPVNTRQEIQSLTSVNGSGLTFTLCDRTDLTDKRSNYFVSFNLPFEQDAFNTGNTLSLMRPELQQLNVDRMIIGNIGSSYYNELIDGRSISFVCPQFSGASISGKTLISSTYTKLEKTQEDDMLGSNVAFLFCDEMNLPYTGTTNGGTITKSANTSWNSSVSYVKRPSATSYRDLQQIDVNTDSRGSISYAVSVPSTYPTNTDQGYNYDIPVGFVALDKGFFVLTHPDVVNNFPFTFGQKPDGSSNAGSSSATTNVYFTSTTTCNSTFVDINIVFKTSVICYIMPGEFYKSTNDSWDVDGAAIEEASSTNGYEPVFISEIALHNVNGEVIAYAKLDEPIQKSFGDFLAFTIDLNV